MSSTKKKKLQMLKKEQEIRERMASKWVTGSKDRTSQEIINKYQDESITAIIPVIDYEKPLHGIIIAAYIPINESVDIYETNKDLTVKENTKISYNKLTITGNCIKLNNGERFIDDKTYVLIYDRKERMEDIDFHGTVFNLSGDDIYNDLKLLDEISTNHKAPNYLRILIDKYNIYYYHDCDRDTYYLVCILKTVDKSIFIKKRKELVFDNDGVFGLGTIIKRITNYDGDPFPENRDINNKYTLIKDSDCEDLQNIIEDIDDFEIDAKLLKYVS